MFFFFHSKFRCSRIYTIFIVNNSIHSYLFLFIYLEFSIYSSLIVVPFFLSKNVICVPNAEPRVYYYGVVVGGVCNKYSTIYNGITLNDFFLLS